MTMAKDGPLEAPAFAPEADEDDWDRHTCR
jgi:hypothetical protein